MIYGNINHKIPDEKSSIVKQILKAFGVTMISKEVSKPKPSEYAGIISKDEARKLIVDIENDRKRWERDI